MGMKHEFETGFVSASVGINQVSVVWELVIETPAVCINKEWQVMFELKLKEGSRRIVTALVFPSFRVFPGFSWFG